MAYRKLGVDNKHRRSMLATLTKQVIMSESITTTETRAKEARKFVEKMVTYGKKGDLVSRRKALAFLHNDTEVVNKVFDDLAKRYEKRNGGYTQILKLSERRGDDALMVILKLVDEAKPEVKAPKTKNVKKKDKKENKKVLSSYFIFCKEVREKPENKDKKLPNNYLKEEWKKLSDTEKAVYKEKYTKLRDEEKKVKEQKKEERRANLMKSRQKKEKTQ